MNKCEYNKEYKCDAPATMQCKHCGKFTCDSCAEVMDYACECFEVEKDFISEVNELEERVLEGAFGTKNRAELLQRINKIKEYGNN